MCPEQECIHVHSYPSYKCNVQLARHIPFWVSFFILCVWEKKNLGWPSTLSGHLVQIRTICNSVRSKKFHSACTSCAFTCWHLVVHTTPIVKPHFYGITFLCTVAVLALIWTNVCHKKISKSMHDNQRCHICIPHILLEVNVVLVAKVASSQQPQVCWDNSKAPDGMCAGAHICYRLTFGF